LHMAPQMPLPLTISCSSKYRLVYLPGFYLSGTNHPRSPGQNPEEPQNDCVCVSVVLCVQCFDAVGWVAGRASDL